MFDYQEILGSYSPTYMYIELFSENEDTLIHEYVHYLQNVSTNFGIEQYTIMRKIFALSIIENHTGKNFSQVKEVIDSVNIFKSNFAQNINRQFSQASVLDIKFNKNEILVAKFGKDIVATATLKIEIDGFICSYIFNVRTIMENMARMIQRHCYPEIKIAKTLDYDICESVISAYYPMFHVTPQNIVALCDLSLLNDYPVNTFFLILTVLRETKYVPSNSVEIYDYMDKNSGFKSSDGKSYTFEKVFKYKADECYKEIQNLYPENDILDDINKWLKDTFDAAHKMRFSNRDFISELLDYPSEVAKKHIILYMNKLDVPLIIKHDKQAIAGINKTNRENLLLLRAEKEIYECLYDGSKKYQCKMKEICQKNANSPMVDELCDDAILKTDSYSDNEYVCPFAILWTKWKLKRYTI